MGSATLMVRHHATSRKVAGSGPDEVTHFFILNLHNTSSRTSPWGLLNPDRSEYQKHKKNVSVDWSTASN
jgi:hypothetical protein